MDWGIDGLLDGWIKGLMNWSAHFTLLCVFQRLGKPAESAVQRDVVAPIHGGSTAVVRHKKQIALDKTWGALPARDR